MDINIDGGILSGGMSTRMQGRDKGLQHFKEKPLAYWVNQALEPFVNKVHLNCNRYFSEYQTICSSICSDTFENFQGPLAGLVSLMEKSTADFLLVSPCDTPLLGKTFGSEMLAFLTTQLENNPHDKILFAAKDQTREHPLHLCISTSYKNDLVNALNEGNRKVMQWANSNHVVWLDLANSSVNFENFNRLEDLENRGRL